MACSEIIYALLHFITYLSWHAKGELPYYCLCLMYLPARGWALDTVMLALFNSFKIDHRRYYHLEQNHEQRFFSQKLIVLLDKLCLCYTTTGGISIDCSHDRRDTSFIYLVCTLSIAYCDWENNWIHSWFEVAIKNLTQSSQFDFWFSIRFFHFQFWYQMKQYILLRYN